LELKYSERMTTGTSGNGTGRPASPTSNTYAMVLSTHKTMLKMQDRME
jgi:hypothetical protein